MTFLQAEVFIERFRKSRAVFAGGDGDAVYRFNFTGARLYGQVQLANQCAALPWPGTGDTDLGWVRLVMGSVCRRHLDPQRLFKIPLAADAGSVAW